jgi:hypothetical protein
MQRSVLLRGITASLAIAAGMPAARPALADVAIVQHRDGTTGTITRVDDHIGIYADAHGNTNPLAIPDGMAGHSDPHGSMPPPTATPFGTPAPPNRLTPAPLLPFNPNRPLMPPPALVPPAAAAPPGAGSFGRGAPR